MNKHIFKAFLGVSFWTILSRISGLIRDIFLAWSIGASFLADAFFVAFRLPNLFRRLTAEGALVQSFLPKFTKHKEKKGNIEALKLASEIQSIITLFFLVFILIAELFMAFFIYGLAPGFSKNPQQLELAVKFSKITILYLPLVSLVAFWGSIAQSSGKFFPHAISPIILNLCFIAWSVLIVAQFLSPKQIVYIVPISGLIQIFFVGFWLHKMKMLPKIIIPKFSKEANYVWKKFVPAALGAGVLQINLLVDTVLASFLKSGSISYLYYSDRIAQLPLGIIAISLSTVLLPNFSKAEANNDINYIKSETIQSIKFVSMFSIPSFIGIFLLSEIIIEVLFGRGGLNSLDITSISDALKAYSIGIPAFLLIKVLQTSFFSSGDTLTPFKISLITVLINIILSVILMKFYSHVGIALASSISAFFTVFTLSLILIRRKRLSTVFLKNIFQLLFLAIPFIFIMYVSISFTQSLNILISLILLVLSGLVVWVFLLYCFRLITTKSILNLINKNSLKEK